MFSLNEAVNETIVGVGETPSDPLFIGRISNHCLTHLLILLGITVLPFSATREILQGQWPFGRILCHIWLTIDVLYCTASIYGLMFISIERYIGVTRPLRYPLIITHRRTVFVIFLAWSVSILISITPFLGWQKKMHSIDDSCSVNDNLSYVLFSCSFSFYIPLIVILCVYGRIYGEAIRQYRFLTGGEKQVRLNDIDGRECVTLRVHIPQHLSSSTTSLSNGLSTTTSTGQQSNGKRVSTQLSPNGSNKLTKFKREKKAGKSSGSAERSDCSSRLAKTLGIVVGMFILCWLPFFLLLTISKTDGAVRSTAMPLFIQKRVPRSNRALFSPSASGWAIAIPVSIHSSTLSPVENSEGEKDSGVNASLVVSSSLQSICLDPPMSPTEAETIRRACPARVDDDDRSHAGAEVTQLRHHLGPSLGEIRIADE